MRIKYVEAMLTYDTETGNSVREAVAEQADATFKTFCGEVIDQAETTLGEVLVTCAVGADLAAFVAATFRKEFMAECPVADTDDIDDAADTADDSDGGLALERLSAIDSIGRQLALNGHIAGDLVAIVRLSDLEALIASSNELEEIKAHRSAA